MNSIYLAEKDMHDRIQDNLSAMERKRLRKSVQGAPLQSKNVFANTVRRELAAFLTRAAENLHAWYSGSRVASRTR
jgi:hypothetical protein